MSSRPPAPIQPITDRVPIIKPDGTPTPYFIQYLQERGLDINGRVTPAQVAQMIEDWSANRLIGTTAPLLGGGTLDNDLALSHDVSGVLAGTYGDSTNVARITVDDKGHVTEVEEVAISGGGGGSSDEAPFIKPAKASFTQRTGSGATINDYAQGIVLQSNITNTNTNDLTYCVQPIITPGAAGWKATARLKRYTPLTNWMATGMILRDSAGGRSRLYWIGWDVVQGFNWNTYINDTSFNGVAAISTGFFDMDFWLQIEDNLTDHIIRVSKDGYNFQEIFRHSRTTWMTPDQVGFFLNPNGGNSPSGLQTRPMPFSCLSWEMVALP